MYRDLKKRKEKLSLVRHIDGKHFGDDFAEFGKMERWVLEDEERKKDDQHDTEREDYRFTVSSSPLANNLFVAVPDWRKKNYNFPKLRKILHNILVFGLDALPSQKKKTKKKQSEVQIRRL